MRRLAGAAGAMILGFAGTAQAAPAMWRVSDADSQVYLFGTLHALQPGQAWRTPLYDAVLARAGTVWFEADLQSGDPDTLRLLVRRYGVDPDRPLSRKLAPSDLGALARQTDLARVDHLRPWAAALMLSMQPALARGASVDKGADVTITRAARAESKRIRTFETLEDQARMFASLPEDSEVRYLADVVRERSRGPRLRLPFKPASLEDAWAAGSLGDGHIADMRSENPALYDAFLRRRNEAWADRLAEGMAGSGVELVNVGAFHLIGPDGLPTLLAARGFRVERVQ
ncbi:TraB/GumN family protein [Phenylobacterium sp. RIFCSPHIGHO2_01_FULL_69_31]|uniref:TraB/GumN family protein n=1 Tax=Phenylobacterium sp. RIFCSPHIGHO2_01_FULL_69_31 TaxID=1801944 RepID=UPI0025E8DE98|nr:TraB/GumN family protein [Phenylobacterium sp. RIFCSPHIGHO2_01_FULL_69_31]